MRLQQELDALRDWCFENTPADIWRVRQEAINALVSTGVAEKAVHAGGRAPVFHLKDSYGGRVSSLELLRTGPIVVLFYRGGWCPYCRLDLRAFQAASAAIKAAGASIIAISPQSPVQSRTTVELNKMSFPSLVDYRGLVSRAFGLRWKLPLELREAEISTGLDLSKINAEPSWTLSMPAVYVINCAGTIEYADVSADYTRRCDPTDLAPLIRVARPKFWN